MCLGSYFQTARFYFALILCLYGNSHRNNRFLISKYRTSCSMELFGSFMDPISKDKKSEQGLGRKLTVLLTTKFVDDKFELLNNDRFLSL